MTKDETLESLIHGLKSRLTYNKEVMSYGACLELEGFIGDIRQRISDLNSYIGRVEREKQELEAKVVEINKVLNEVLTGICTT